MDDKTILLLSNLSFPEESEIHVSRHLTEISERLKDILSRSQLKKCSSYNGSKFHPAFASDTTQILPNILKYGELKRFVNVNFNQLKLEFIFSENQFPNGVGVDAAKSNKLSKTLILVLHRNNNKWEVTTCFPKITYA